MSDACGLRRRARRWQGLYLGPDAGNLLEVVSVARDDGSEVVIHAMRMRRSCEPFLREKGEVDS
jgi:hypothetical protein